jgi:SdpI/YfhL protein family
MNLVNLLVGLFDIGTGLLCIAMSIPLLRGSVPRNTFYGFRFRQSFGSEEQWQHVKRYGAKHLIRWSLLILVMGICTFVIPLQDNLASS